MLLEASTSLEMRECNPREGFDELSKRIHKIIECESEYSYFIFDTLTDLFRLGPQTK